VTKINSQRENNIEGARFYVSLLPIKERDENSTDVQVYIFLSVK